MPCICIGGGGVAVTLSIGVLGDWDVSLRGWLGDDSGRRMGDGGAGRLGCWGGAEYLLLGAGLRG